MSAPDAHRYQASELQGSALQVHEIQAGLPTNRLGGPIHYFFEVESTNSYAHRLAENGAAEGAMVIAETQTKGRGRLGRLWVSPPYANLHYSVILRPTLPPVHAPQITLMAAVALADSIASLVPCSPAIKWPNDILMNGKKTAGILTEASWSSARIEFVILGIGVNLNFPEELMPESIRPRATSLLAVRQKTVQREAFVRRLIQDLDRCYGELEESGFGALAPQWEARFALRNCRVRTEMAGEVVFGTAKGMDRDGALIVEKDDGTQQRVIAGDVIPVED
jgi:BirA family transcriptional regulator, biotin operon repressor / biotin---[acetyl-CoA-carboxylase] ligase